MGYQIGGIRLVEVRKQQYERLRAQLMETGCENDGMWQVILAADNLVEAINLAR